jgi:cation/acetate symporter
MALNFAVTWGVSRVTRPPPEPVRMMVDAVRVPRGAGEAHEISA